MIGFRAGGPDVSAYQGPVSWEEVARHHRFAFCKATEGRDYVDPRFQHNWAFTHRAGLIRGCYHFARPQLGRAGQQEAMHFLNTIRDAGGLHTGDLRPVLDIETSRDLTRRELQGWVSDFVHTIAAKTGVMPIIYTGSWWRDHGLEHHYGCPLWLAAYVRFPSLYVPHPWRHWSLWQHTDHADVRGIFGLCDFNKVRSRGTLERLRIK